ncbi:MAG: 6,7-dimethyl-8-ribityllumazine synthase [Chitinophagaceae bacterium]
MAEISGSTLFTNLEGIEQIKDAFVILIKTEWNAEIVNELEKGCLNTLNSFNIESKTIVVPGAVEIPFTINQYWQKSLASDKPHAFIALGCVVRGGTPHFDYVCQSVTSGITHLNITLPVPVIFGILTVDTQQQAEERVGGAHGHKGEEAAISAIKMILLNRSFIKDK